MTVTKIELIIEFNIIQLPDKINRSQCDIGFLSALSAAIPILLYEKNEKTNTICKFFVNPSSPIKKLNPYVEVF